MSSPLEKMYATLIDDDFQRDLFGDLPGFRQKGAGYIAHCPYHQDALPTLVIYHDRPEFFCFACGRRGDWIDFLKEQRGMTFQAALSQLSDAAGIGPPEAMEGSWESQRSRSQLLEVAMGFFITGLWSRPGEEVLHYLYARGYATGEVEGMALGHYPGYAATTENLSLQGFSVERVRAQLLNQQTAGTDRPGLVIPYRDVAGRLMGLVHKDIRTDGPGSYTPLTDMSGLEGVPFLMYRSRRQPAVIVVEGFLDALLLDQARLKPVMGIGAGGLSASHLETAASCGATHFMLALGNGEHQRQATGAAIRLIRGQGLSVSILPIPPEYKDLDEYIRRTCLDHFNALLKRAVPPEEWLEEYA